MRTAEKGFSPEGGSLPQELGSAVEYSASDLWDPSCQRFAHYIDVISEFSLYACTSIAEEVNKQL